MPEQPMLTLTDSVHGVPLRPSAERRWINRGVREEMTIADGCIEEDKEPPFLSVPRTKCWWFETGRQCLAEFIGDLTFIFLGSLAVGTGAINSGSASTLTAAFGQGLTIALLIISIGHISGGHFNPAVTVGFLTARAIHPIRASLFIIAQLLGGIFGALFLRLVTSASSYERAYNGITTVTNPGEVSSGEAVACELILTYFLVQTVLCSFLDSDGKNVLGALAVGFVILVDILAGGDISGASMNPARSFGPSVAASIYHSWSVTGRSTYHDPWAYQYVFWVGPIIGGILAGLVYRIVLANDAKRWNLRSLAKKPT